MRFSKYIKLCWPPISNGRLIESPISHRRSNYFSQYIRHTISSYACLHKNVFWLSEVECKQQTHKLDYMVCKGDIGQYFSGSISSRELNWIALIETQWGNNNEKKMKDFMDNDFAKLYEWKQSKQRQIKVAIFDVPCNKERWKEMHIYYGDLLLKNARDSSDSNSNYLMIIYYINQIDSSVCSTFFTNKSVNHKVSYFESN